MCEHQDIIIHNYNFSCTIILIKFAKKKKIEFIS